MFQRLVEKARRAASPTDTSLARIESRLADLEDHADAHVHTDVAPGANDTGVAYIPEAD